MDKGPHVIKLSPGNVPPIIHLSQYEGGDGVNTKTASELDLDFILLDSDGLYYQFTPRVAGSGKLPGKLYYARPDGFEGEISLSMRDSSTTSHTDSSGATVVQFKEPHIISVKNIPFELTEVAGDVICEIDLAPRVSNVVTATERTENFIIRVEPKPRPVSTPSYSSWTGAGTETEGGTSVVDRKQPTYFGSDTADDSLVSWADVVEAANEGTLDKLIAPGQEIRAVMLTTGQLMGIRCVHVEDSETAWFESKNLFLAPSEYNPWSIGGALFGYMAAQAWASGSGIGTQNTHGPAILPNEIRSVGTYFGSPACHAVYGPSSGQAYNYSDNFYGDIGTYQFDYYKNSANRIKKNGLGETKPWCLGETDARLVGGKIVTNYIYGVLFNGDLTRYSINDNPDEVYVPIAWRLKGDRSGMGPVDIQSWQDVKKAAAKGKLKNSNLELGQLMPELPTVGVLRCVHIEDSWAVFDSETVKAECLPQSAMSTILASVNNTLTDDEKSIFTVLGKSNNVDVYTQPASGTNLHVTGGGGVSAYINNTLGNLLLDYYADATISENVREPKRVKSSTYWVYYGSAYKTYINLYGGAQTYGVNSYTTMKHSLNPVFVVGNIS